LYLLLTNTKKSQEVTLVRRWLQQTSLPSTEDDTNNIFIPESFRILNDFFCNLNTDLEKFRIYVIEELSEALNIFKKHNWMGHVANLENCISSISKFFFKFFDFTIATILIFLVIPTKIYITERSNI